MKTKYLALTVALLTICLSACNSYSSNINSSIEVSSSEVASKEEISSSSEANDSSSENNSSENDEAFISFWGNESVEDAIEKTIKYDIPYYYAPKYEVESSKDALNDDVLTIYFEGFKQDDVDSNRDKYVNICISAGYKNETQKIDNGDGGDTTLYILTKSIGNRQNIEINVVSGRKNENSPYCFAAFASRFYDFESEIFPNYVLKHYFDYELPVVENANARYLCQVGIDEQTKIKNAYIEISFVDQAYEVELFNLLKSNGYKMDSEYYDDFGYMATNQDNKYEVQFKYTKLALAEGSGIAMFTWPL